MRVDVLKAMKVSVVVFCVVAPCGIVGGYQSFEGTYCLHLQGENGGDTSLHN
jgi:hypothetical protein